MSSIKRHISIQPISREHHSALLFCWHIKQGILKNVSAQRMSNYALWFFETQIERHFEFEEKFMLPILIYEKDLVNRTIKEHSILKELFKSTDEIGLTNLAKKLQEHIRFEERLLFNEIEKVASHEQLHIILENSMNNSECPVWQDTFWKE